MYRVVEEARSRAVWPIPNRHRDGQVAPGEKLPREHVLAAQPVVSRTAMREAL